MDFTASLGLIAPELTLSLGGLALLLWSAWGGDRAARAISIAAVALIVAAAFFCLPMLRDGAIGPIAAAFGDLYRADAFAGVAKLLTYVGAVSVLIVAPDYFSRFGQMRAEFPVLVLFAVVGMGLMVSASDLITLYIGLELNSLAAYVLASSLRADERSAEAGLKYFVLGALASGILLFGMSLTYGFTGTTSFAGIRVALAGGLPAGALFGLIFMFSGLAFKISAVPFHMWTPDVYEGAPTPVTAFFATAPKVAAIALSMRVALDAFGGHDEAWRQVVVFASLASIVVGALGAIGQDNIKRLLAYSSINNVGFILIGLAIGTPAGASAMLVYLAIYVAMTIAGFVTVLMLRGDDGLPLETFGDISGLSSTRPWLAFFLLMTMFSLAGIPPLFGFYGKFVVWRAAVDGGYVAFAGIAAAASVIGAFYYLKFIKIMYLDEPVGRVAAVDRSAHWALLIVAGLIISPLGYLLSGPLGALADRAAAALFFVA